VTGRRSKHGRIVAWKAFEGLEASIQAIVSCQQQQKQVVQSHTTSSGRTANLETQPRPNSDKPRGADYARKVKEVKSKLWGVIHLSKFGITRGKWEYHLLKVKEKLETYFEHITQSEQDAVATGASVQYSFVNRLSAPSSSSQNVIYKVTPTTGNSFRCTRPITVKRELKPGDKVKVYWVDGMEDDPSDNEGGNGKGGGGEEEEEVQCDVQCDPNTGQLFDATLLVRDGIESWELIYSRCGNICNTAQSLFVFVFWL
jgi:hypothetical protein